MEETAVYGGFCGGLCFSARLMLMKARDISWTETSVLEYVHRMCYMAL